MNRESLEAELKSAADAIDFASRDWHHVERWLNAKRWLIAHSLLSPGSETQAAHNRGRAQMCEELVRLREQWKPNSID